MRYRLQSLDEQICVESSAGKPPVSGGKQRIADEAGSYSSPALTK